MSYPAKIEVALTILNYCRGVEVGPVPQVPGLDWQTSMGRKLTTSEERIKDDALQTLAEYLHTGDFGPPMIEERHPMAAMILAQMNSGPESDPPAEPPGPTVEKPQPPPTTPGDDANKPNEPKPEEKKPAETAPTEKAKT